MTSKIQHFLLIYDHGRGRLVRVEHFGTDSKGAVARYEEVEKIYRGDRAMDIVLVGSDSLDTVKVTHANYFEANDEMADLTRYVKAVSDRHQPA